VPHEQLANLLVLKRNSGKDAVLISRPRPIPSEYPLGTLPGVGTFHDYVTGDPFKAAWTTEPYLRTILGFKTVGFAFCETGDTEVELISPVSGAVRVSKDAVLVIAITTPDFPAARPKFVLFDDWREFAAVR
jgi:hypothetical protein